jgi:heme/copper-type cytochrome/quinol oxidase subunit 2
MTEKEATWFTVAIVIVCTVIAVFVYIVFEYYKNKRK